MRVLSIDPALRKTGYAVVEQTGPKSYRALTYGVIHNKPKVLQSRCLVAIRQALVDVISEFQPTCCSIESTIYVQSFRTAIVLGAARIHELADQLPPPPPKPPLVPRPRRSPCESSAHR